MAPELSAKDAISRVGMPDTVFVDVREPQEFAATGVLPGAVLAPMSRIQALTNRRDPDFVEAFASGKELVIYCATGRRSAAVVEGLARIGIPFAINLAGGIVAWKAEGGPVEPME